MQIAKYYKKGKKIFYNFPFQNKSDNYDLKDDTPKKIKQVINLILKNRSEYTILLKNNKCTILFYH